jgi:hypothetical protein
VQWNSVVLLPCDSPKDVTVERRRNFFIAIAGRDAAAVIEQGNRTV